MHLFLALLALLGHAFFWIGPINRLHAFAISRRIINRLTVACLFCGAAIPIAVAAWLYARNVEPGATASWERFADGSIVGTLIAVYVAMCWCVAAITLLRLACFRFLHRRPSIVRFHGTRRAAIDPNPAAVGSHETSHHFLTRLPLNEVLQLHVTDWTLDAPRLSPALDGLSIVHLSDFHFTGRVGKAYFREVVRTSNELQPDLVAVTGDLVDTPACVDWIPDTLGQLTARHGVFFILGNHDRRSGDVPGLRRLIEQCGLVDLGGRQRQIEINGQPVWLAGNELPWMNGPVGNGQASSVCETPEPAACGVAVVAPPLRIVLAHSPDQLAWARAQDADVMLAGHTHGGQVCIPPLGAIFSPSVCGVKYISGVYYLPPTILHVTRGISGDAPVRWNCPPEIARLKLVKRAEPSSATRRRK